MADDQNQPLLELDAVRPDRKFFTVELPGEEAPTRFEFWDRRELTVKRLSWFEAWANSAEEMDPEGNPGEAEGAMDEFISYAVVEGMTEEVLGLLDPYQKTQIVTSFMETSLGTKPTKEMKADMAKLARIYT